MSDRKAELRIPANVRSEVIERDGGLCRLCGAAAPICHVHHVLYRSQGGDHTPANLVSLHLRCHGIVHENVRLWRPILLQLPVTPGVTGLQLRRWASGSAPELLRSPTSSADEL
jgi:HNH endonuclease